MLGDIDRGPPVLSTECQTLQQTEEEQDRRCQQADRGVRRQAPDQERRQTHDGQGDQKGVLPSNQISDAAEDERSKRTDEEPGGK